MNAQMVRAGNFYNLGEAAALLGCSPKRLRRQVKALGIRTYKSGLDRRQRLLRGQDVELLRTPIVEEAPIAHAERVANEEGRGLPPSTFPLSFATLGTCRRDSSSDAGLYGSTR